MDGKKEVLKGQVETIVTMCVCVCVSPSVGLNHYNYHHCRTSSSCFWSQVIGFSFFLKPTLLQLSFGL